MRFVRYCDDFSIFLGSKRAANRVMRDISHFVRDKLHLEVNQAKSAVRRPVNYEYLGFGFVPNPVGNRKSSGLLMVTYSNGWLVWCESLILSVFTGRTGYSIEGC